MPHVMGLFNGFLITTRTTTNLDIFIVCFVKHVG